MIETGRELDGDLQSLSGSDLTPVQAWQLSEHARGLPGLAPDDADGGFTKQPADGVGTATLRPADNASFRPMGPGSHIDLLVGHAGSIRQHSPCSHAKVALT